MREFGIGPLAVKGFQSVSNQCGGYRIDDLGAKVWVDAVWTVEDTRASIKEMMGERPGEYIFNLSTREKMLVKPGDLMG